MDNCSQHKKEVAGISDMKVLAEMIGDLHYKTLAKLLDHLSTKIYNDGHRDFIEKRRCLGHELFMASNNLNDAYEAISKAWQISKSFMENKNQSK